nr:immunoglobulin heavy chain junction region [Mus musculus]
CALTGTNFDYW